MIPTRLWTTIAVLCAAGLLSLTAACGAPALRSIAPVKLSAATSDPSAAQPSGDAVRGAKLFSKFQPAAGMACANCHRVDSEERLVGPGLLNVAQRASNNVDERLTRRGIDPAAPDRVERYLRAAIVDPTGYVLPGYPDIMPKNWGKVFSNSELNDLIAYLRSLNG